MGGKGSESTVDVFEASCVLGKSLKDAGWSERCIVGVECRAVDSCRRDVRARVVVLINCEWF